MRIEVLCTGDELLTGVTADTNTPFFAARLLRLGETVARTTVVPDDLHGIAEVLREVAARADVVLVSGGLGPTADDVTAEAAALALGVPVEAHPPTVELLRQRLAQRGLELSPQNERQAHVPRGATVAPNPVGSAPMFQIALGRAQLFFVPGVPREYRALVEGEVLPRIAALKAAAQDRTARSFRLLKTVGVPEAELDRRLAPIAAAHPGVRVGFRTEPPENHVELLASGGSTDEAERALAAAEAACLAELGDAVFGRDDETLPGAILGLLRRARQTVSFAESCTGGWVAMLFTRAPGASEVFPGAAVTYAERLKVDWADVPRSVIDDYGEVSSPVAEHMAEGVRARAGTSWAVSVTGFAGPTGGTDLEPVGAVYIGVAGPSGTTASRHLFYGDRDRIRLFAAYAALDALRKSLLAEGHAP